MGFLYNVVSLSAQAATEAAQETERLFGLDYQTLFDTALTMITVLVVFLFVSNVLIKPMQKLLDERKAILEDQAEKTGKNLEAANSLKEEYQDKLQQANKEADAILSEARKTSLKKEQQLLDEAKAEAAKILAKARNDAAADLQQAQTAVHSEIKDVASMMAAKLVKQEIDTTVSDSLLNETLKEVGDETC